MNVITTEKLKDMEERLDRVKSIVDIITHQVAKYKAMQEAWYNLLITMGEPLDKVDRTEKQVADLFAEQAK